MTKGLQHYCPSGASLRVFWLCSSTGSARRRLPSLARHVELVGVISSPNVALGLDGIVAANGDDGRIHFMKRMGKKSVDLKPRPDGHFAISPDGKSIVAAGRDNNLYWIDPVSGSETMDAPFVHSNIRSFVLNGNGKMLAIAAIEHDMLTMSVFDAASGKLLYRSRAPAPTKRASPIGLSTRQGAISYLEAGTRSSGTTRQSGHTERGLAHIRRRGPAYGSGERYNMSGEFDNLGNPRRAPAHAARVLTDGKYLLACSDDSVTVLDRTSGKFSPIVRDKPNYVAAGLQTNPKAFWLVTAGGTFKTLDPVTDLQSRAGNLTQSMGTCSAARSADGKLYVTGVDGGM